MRWEIAAWQVALAGPLAVTYPGRTGAGKSSTANTLSGRTHKPFAQSNTVTSVTQAISHRDYSFGACMSGHAAAATAAARRASLRVFFAVNLPWRVVDTPGLCDTNRPGAAIAGELGRLARLAPHGIAAFVIVVPRGRLTAERASWGRWGRGPSRRSPLPTLVAPPSPPALQTSVPCQTSSLSSAAAPSATRSSPSPLRRTRPSRRAAS